VKIINCKKKLSSINKDISDICSRHILVFGSDIQERISSLAVGVVSVGGLGSVLIELLMRLFPKKLIFIDDDIVEVSNLNRLTGASLIDAKLKTKKVDLISRNILKFNPDQVIVPIHGDFLKEGNQEKLKQCDFIFGASDSNAVRIATNHLCLAHGIPYLDCGVGAFVEKGQLRAAGGQVIKILPDSGFCLHCSGMFDIGKAMNEFLSDEEKKRQEDQGYIRGTNINAPQVYALNMSVASQAVWMFMRMVSGEEIDFDGIAIDAKDFKSHTWKESTRENQNCPTCGISGISFGGDTVDLLCKEYNDPVTIQSINTFTDNYKGATHKENAKVNICASSFINYVIGDIRNSQFPSEFMGYM